MDEVWRGNMKDFIGETFIPEELCDKLIKLHEDIPWMSDEVRPDERGVVDIFPIIKQRGRAGKGSYSPHIKTSVDVGISPVCIYQPKRVNQVFWPYLETIQKYFLEIEKAIYVYFSEIGMHSPELKGSVGWSFSEHTSLQESIQIQKYEPNEGFFSWHFERSNDRIAMSRELVFMTYLNDVPDGGTHFYSQKRLIKAKKGKTVIWPAGFTHVHKGQISKKHIKYIATGWINWHDDKQTD